MIFGVLSTITGMMGAQQQANAAEAQAKAEQQAAEYNATILRNNAQSENDATTQRENQARFKSDLLAGRDQAMAAESGAGMDGSNLDLMRQNAVQAELDALNIRHAGQAQSSNLLAQANLQDYQGKVAGMRGQQARQSGKLGVMSALISGMGRTFQSGSSSGAIPSVY